jgi:predicted ArsR family transcriptional regulator
MSDSNKNPKDEGNKKILLKFLRTKPEATISDVSNKLGVDNDKAREYLSELIDKELIHVYKTPDRRSKREFYSLNI